MRTQVTTNRASPAQCQREIHHEDRRLESRCVERPGPRAMRCHGGDVAGGQCGSVQQLSTRKALHARSGAEMARAARSERSARARGKMKMTPAGMLRRLTASPHGAEADAF